MVEAQPALTKRIHENSVLMYEGLLKGIKDQPMVLFGEKGSPFFHLQLKWSTGSRDEDERILQEIVDVAARDGVLLTRAKYVVAQELTAPSPSIRVTISAGFTKREVDRGINVIRDAIRRILKVHSSRFQYHS